MEFIAGTIDVNGSVSETQVWTILQELLRDEAGYCGYKKPSISVQSDAIPSFIVISPKYGIVLIDVIDHKVSGIEEEYWTYDSQEIFYSRDIILTNFSSEVETRLKKDLSLYNRKENKILLPVSLLLVFLQNTQRELDQFKGDSITVKTLSKDSFQQHLYDFFAALKQQELSDEHYSKAISVLEGTDILRKKQPAIKEPKSKNDFIQKSLEQTFELDETQRQVAMQLANGPQRIRGLAGTGKTVILCLKAAIAHQEFPDYKILFLFHTRSMYPQVRELIAKYYTREAKQPVNWDNVQVLHAWGGRTTEPGLYWCLCQEYGVQPLTFRDGASLKNIFGSLLTQHREKLKPVYDLVLIDEAQDLPAELFETVFHLTKGEAEKKRIVWAYDEFQTLTDLQIKEPEQLFGTDRAGKPNLPNTSLEGKYGLIDKDYVLSNSYRNPRVGLMVAHALALGLYNPLGNVERIEYKSIWQALGYCVIEPANKEKFSEGDPMVIERPEEFSRNKLENLLKEHQHNEQRLIRVYSAPALEDEIKFVVDEIQRFVKEGGVDPTEIIVVTLDIKTAKNDLFLIRQALGFLQIRSTTPGFIEEASVFKEKGTVTLTTPFRAKGNEGNVVFVINSQKVVEDTIFRARNALFVAITRARGWCYITGHDNEMNILDSEIKGILADYPYFRFKQPSDTEIKRRRTLLSMQGDKEVQKRSEFLEQILRENPELFAEKAFQNQDILNVLLKKRELNQK